MVRAGMKQARLAEITGFSKGYISDLVSGKKSGPSVEAGKKFAEVLGVSPEWLMTGNSQSSADPKGYDVGDPACVMREDSPIYAARVPQQLSLDERVERLEKVLEAILKGLQEL